MWHPLKRQSMSHVGLLKLLSYHCHVMGWSDVCQGTHGEVVTTMT